MAKILVCDDTPDILEMVKFILEGEGFEVLTASEGRDVLSVIGRQNPDLVLLDLRMPGLDGFGVLRELRLKPDEAPPVVVLSAKGLDEDRRAALAAGARDYLFKPFTLAQLLQTVRRQLGEEG
jgi:DNA-binding response OmpR family regulator